MKFKQSSIRPRGQRSIATSFLIRGAKGSGDSDASVENEIKPPAKKGSTLSLSDFLNRKLHKSSVLPSSAPGKAVACSSTPTGGVVEMIGKVGGKEKRPLSIDAGVFDMFKNVEKNANSVTDSDCSDGIVNRKRKNIFEACGEESSSRKVLAVIGEDSGPMRGGKRRVLARKEERRRPLFNHYKSGGGWWDENMEGLANEEIGGGTEAWEGVGCTTLGGLEWN